VRPIVVGPISRFLPSTPQKGIRYAPVQLEAGEIYIPELIPPSKRRRKRPRS
jgi:hypothetical protein